MGKANDPEDHADKKRLLRPVTSSFETPEREGASGRLMHNDRLRLIWITIIGIGCTGGASKVRSESVSPKEAAGIAGDAPNANIYNDKREDEVQERKSTCRIDRRQVLLVPRFLPGRVPDDALYHAIGTITAQFRSEAAADLLSVRSYDEWSYWNVPDSRDCAMFPRTTMIQGLGIGDGTCAAQFAAAMNAAWIAHGIVDLVADGYVVHVQLVEAGDPTTRRDVTFKLSGLAHARTAVRAAWLQISSH